MHMRRLGNKSIGDAGARAIGEGLKHGSNIKEL